MDTAELSSIIAQVLGANGASVLFGVPGGGANLELVSAAERSGITFVLAHTENAAAFMAGAHGELTGIPTPCLVTRGPGAASSANGVAQAWLDRQPLLLLTDTVPASEAHRVPHQRLDQRAMFGPVTKWSGVLGGEDPAGTVRRAVEMARAPTPGPVHLDIDASSTGCTPPRAELRAPRGDRTTPAEARTLLARARRPVVLVGMAAKNSSDAVRSLVNGTGVPVLQTYKAKGVVPESWPNCVGVLTGAKIEAPVLEAADLLLAVGLDTVELIPAAWPYAAPVIALSPWRTDNRYLAPTVEVVGPLDDLIADLGVLRDGWGSGFIHSAREHALDDLLSGPCSAGLAPTAVARTVRAAAPPGSLATVDSGAHMLPVTSLWTTDGPGEFLVSSGLASMGFGLPAAIAAAQVHPDRRTFCFTGDGGLGMVLAELETVARLRHPVTVIVFNDSTLSLIDLKRRPGHGGAGAVRYRPTDFAAIAAAVGIPAQRVGTSAELDAAIRQAVAGDDPTLVDAIVDPSEYVHIMRAVRGSSPQPGTSPR